MVIPGAAVSRNPVSHRRVVRPKPAQSNIISRTRRLSPHPEIIKSQGSSLMSLYSVQTDLTTSSVQSIRRRFETFYQEKDTKEKERAMAEVKAATKHIPIVTRKTKLPPVKCTDTFLPVSNEIFPDQNWTTKRHSERHNKESLNEWDIMKDCDKGKACHWSGTHRHVMTSVDYNSVKQRPHVIRSQRNGLPEASRGDKSYQSPEYSSDFHKHGSTLPLANFSGRARDMSDTYIPLVEPLRRYKTFTEKEKERQHSENERLVMDLEAWRPATPLIWRPTRYNPRLEAQQQVHTPSSVS